MKKLLLFTATVFFFFVSGFGQDWTELMKLESSDQQGEDNHGISVALSGDYIISGAWHEDHDGNGSNFLSNAGAAYIYKYSSSTDEWIEEAKLVAADRETGDWFGISVDISGTYAVIGAVEENASRGAAYVFERGSNGIWIQVAKLEAPNRQSSDRFGHSVSISGNTIVVGAYHEDEDENDGNTLQNAGSAYIFNRVAGNWSFFQKIVASDRDTNDYFGFSVSVWEDKMIVGAYHRDTPTLSEYGGAYAFKFNGVEWEETKILEGIEPYLGDRFGWSVDLYDNYYIVGAPYHDYDTLNDNQKNNAGAAYIFNEANNWAQLKVVGGDRTDQDNVGESVAIFNNRAVVGSPLQDYGINGDPPFWSSGGAIFVYEVDNDGLWNQTQKLLTSDRFTSDKFGHSVDLNAELIIGGAPEDNGNAGPSTGALYIFGEDILGFEDISEGQIEITTFPNPTDGAMTILFGQSYKMIEVKIVNIYGQPINHLTAVEADSMNITINGATGIYIIQCTINEKVTQSIRVCKI